MRALGMIKLVPELTYLVITFLLAGCIGRLLLNFKIIDDSLFFIVTAVIGLTSLLVETTLPRSFKTTQIVLSFLVFTIFSNMPKITPVAYSLLVIIGSIKVYALFSIFNVFKRRTSNDTSSYLPGDKFYSSQAWRKLRFAILEQQGRVCRSCGEKRVIDENGEPISYHVDHIRPRSKFPEYALDPNNLTVACACCNLGRSNLYSNDYRIDRVTA